MRWSESDLKNARLKGVRHGQQLNKYRNTKTECDGLIFDSKHESEVYRELMLRAKAKEIYDLERQVPFDIRVNGFLIGKYIADFTYMTFANDVFTVVDAKSEVTKKLPLYLWKKKLMKACHGIDIVEL